MDTNSSYKHYSLGNDLRAKGKDKEALEAYKRALELNPKFVLARKEIDEIILSQEKKHLHLADLFLQEDKVDRAIDEYHEILKYNPKSWKAHKNLANMYTKIGKMTKAVIEIKKAISIAPDLCGLHLTLAKFCEMQDNFEQALEEYTIALDLNPNDMVIRLHKENTEKIKSISENPSFQTDPFLMVDVGNLFLEKEMPSKAVDYFHKAHIFAQNNQEIIFSIANAYHKLQNFEKAIEYYQKALEITPATVNLDELYYNLGLSYSGSQQHKEAIGALESCIRINPHGKAASRAEANIELLRTYIRTQGKKT